MYFPYPQFFTSSSATSSASSSAASSPTSSAPSTPRSHPTSYHATSPYQSSTTSTSPISISSPCAYPSWPTRPSLQSSSRHENAPFAHTAASSYLSDDDLSPLDEEEEELLALQRAMPMRALVDTRAIREALVEEGARKKARKVKVAGRRGSGGSERGERRVKLSTIVEGSYVG
ncbi:hypothetical protein V499_06664 [Pseudogymnoascus sp. VKM F-103]|uniref:Uncharacterized protein n=1 Tax=Pseudogymnoascus verrucosus TaxID=342668 RepID=A0A1B8GQJ8_9PEZI|nr:uncharacterized protein VE01_03677 [Pseudogymnoascus verrucosus]KFY73239.1 hypothetical protein V499_06664 [Pseudogymnoascus sp. VKM F-103]OBT98111.1 hypothetical protein VE01_03677 [Pseudogymnoascus verrucosus]